MRPELDSLDMMFTTCCSPLHEHVTGHLVTLCALSTIAAKMEEKCATSRCSSKHVLSRFLQFRSSCSDNQTTQACPKLETVSMYNAQEVLAGELEDTDMILTVVLYLDHAPSSQDVHVRRSIEPVCIADMDHAVTVYRCTVL